MYRISALVLLGLATSANLPILKAQEFEVPLPIPRPHYERHHEDWQSRQRRGEIKRHHEHGEHRWHHPDVDDEDEE